MNNTKTPLLTVPLGTEAHDFARQFAAQQATPQKGKRVYFKTLAVYAVHHYLKWLGIETDLNQSDSWHPINQSILNLADLVLPSIGKLECRPVMPGETAFYLPDEVAENCIGYVGVQFRNDLSEVELLGFTPSINTANPPEQINIADLQSLETLIDSINDLKDAKKAIALQNTQKVDTKSQDISLVNLSHWFENIFEGAWQNWDSFVNTRNLAGSFRGTIQLGESRIDDLETIVRGAKLIDLGIQLASHPVALVVTLIPEADQKKRVILQVRPIGRQTYLPQYTRLTVLDESGSMFLEAQARSADNLIQLQFRGDPGEGFSVEVGLGVASITEDFVI
ncbi:MAG TPA: hypothetical protein DD379_04615 [Cyanobacteria bacterium UBA11162]|nr:hypothetical protein [Cyanobacteria bacterium UBA11162]